MLKSVPLQSTNNEQSENNSIYNSQERIDCLRIIEPGRPLQSECLYSSNSCIEVQPSMWYDWSDCFMENDAIAS